MAAKKPETSTPTQSPPTKAEFIRRHRTLSVHEVIKRAKAVGLVLTEQNVWQTRWQDKHKALKKTPHSKAKARHPQVVRHVGSKVDDLEARFVPIILEIGAARAEALFKSTLERIRALGSKPA